MSKYEVLQLCEAYKDEWNDCVLNSKLGYVYDFYQMLVKCEYEQSTNLTFAIKDVKENTIVLIMPLYNRSSILINDQAGTKSFYCRYGPVIRNGLSKKETIEIKEIFLKNLKRLLKAYYQKEIFVELAALCSYGFPNYNAVNPLIFWGFEPRVRYSWIIDLRNDEYTLFENLNRTTRKSIKRISNESRFFVRESVDESIDLDFEKFLILSDETYHRNGIKSKSRDYYWNQFYCINISERRIFFLENIDGKIPEAALMVHLYKNTARITWVVSADIRNRDVVKFLIYKVMLQLKSNGTNYLEMGGAYPYLPITDKRRGISDFKRSFGGFLHPIYMGYFTL